jgi:glycosyltransferase involved in cell wall biosynthesis
MIKRVLFIFLILKSDYEIDKNIVICGYIMKNDGIGNVTENIYESFKKINKSTKFHRTRNLPIPNNIEEADINENFDFLIFCDALYYSSCPWVVGGIFDSTKKLPKAKINIAYLFWETDKVSDKWIEILNQKFNILLLPSHNLVKNFIDSGLKIPVEVIPPNLELFNEVINFKKIHKTNFKTKKNKFIFGYSGTFLEHKNHLDIAKAFLKKYKNNDLFELVLHGKCKNITYDSLNSFLIDNNCNNVRLIAQDLSRNDYLHLIDSFDCMVNVSGGEGFGITARESLLLDKPLILGANSAHLDLISYGGVVPIIKQNKQTAICHLFKEDIGNYSHSNIDEIAYCMQYVVDSYDKLVKLINNQKFEKIFIENDFVEKLFSILNYFNLD